MKIYINNENIFELTETKKKVIKNDILEEEFEQDIKRRVRRALERKYKNCFTRLKAEWLPKLKTMGIKSVPTDDDELAELIFKQPGYKNRNQREQSTKKDKTSIIRTIPNK